MIKIFRKDIRLFLKDKRALLLAFLLPIILVSLFAFAFGGLKGGESKPSPIPLLITDMDHSQVTGKIIAAFDSAQGVTISVRPLVEAKLLVTQGKDVGVLVFYKGFEDSLKRGKRLPMEMFYDKVQEMQIGLLQPILMNTLMKTSIKERSDIQAKNFLHSKFPGLSGAMEAKILKEVDSGFDSSNGGGMSGAKLKMTSMVGEKKDDNSLFLIQAVVGVAIMMLLFSITSLSAGILEERESGTLKRLLYSPVKPVSILFGKMLTAMCVSLSQLIIMFGYASLAFHLDITQNIPALILLVLAISFAIAGMGIFLASIARSRSQAQGLGTLIILTMSALGGSMVPLFIMPAVMKKIAVFTINYWGIQGFYDIFWRNLSTVQVLPRIGILVGIGLVLTILSVRLFKRNIARIA